MVKHEVDPAVVLLPHTHFDRVRDLKQRMNSTKLAEPYNQVIVKKLVAHRSDINGFSVTVRVHGHSGASGIKILRIRSEHLASLRLDDVAPKPRWMKMSCGERAFQGEVVFLAGGKRIEFQDLQSEEINQVVGKT